MPISSQLHMLYYIIFISTGPIEIVGIVSRTHLKENIPSYLSILLSLVELRFAVSQEKYILHYLILTNQNITAALFDFGLD